MRKCFVTFLLTLFACFKQRVMGCFGIRKVAAALFVFQIISLGVYGFHIQTARHVHSPISGEVVHASANYEDMTPVQDAANVYSSVDDTDEDACALFNHLLRPSVASFETTASFDEKQAAITTEVTVRRLDIVYRSTRLLHQAPKNSPPIVIS